MDDEMELKAEYEKVKRAIDTCAEEAKRGKDIQGIPWQKLNITRERYRQTRLQLYNKRDYDPRNGETTEEGCEQVRRDGKLYEFSYNTRAVQPTINHYQMRHMVWATSKHDAYIMSNNSIIHWSSFSQNATEILDVSGNVVPCEEYQGNLLEGFSYVRVGAFRVRDKLLVVVGMNGEIICKEHQGNLLEGFSDVRVGAFQVRDKLLVVAGMNGEIICKHLDTLGVSFCTRPSSYPSNGVEINESLSGCVHFVVPHNNGEVLDFDAETFLLSKSFHFPWAVNCISLSSDGKLLGIVGDCRDGLLADSQTGKTVATFSGHRGYSSAILWHPDGRTFATGNEDKTSRIWDVRNLSSSVAILKGNLGAIRCISFTSNGQYMAMAEHMDFVHIYNVESGYEKRQEIDLLGDISGMSVSPDGESLFIGVGDNIYSSLLWYQQAMRKESTDNQQNAG